MMDATTPWKPEMESVKAKIAVALDPNNPAKKFAQRLTAMLVDTTWKEEPYKSVLADTEITKDKDIELLNELEKLFNLLKGAYETTPTTKKSDLEVYSKLTDNETTDENKRKRKVWVAIQKQKNGTSTKNWGDEALDKAKGKDRGETLDSVKAKAKAEMNKVEENVAFNKIVGNNDKIKNDKEKIKQAQQIFVDAVEAWNKTAADAGLFKKLNDAKNDATKKDAWDAVNLYQKKKKDGNWVDSTDGFAEGALKHVKESVELAAEVKKIFGDSPTEAALTTNLETLFNSAKFKDLPADKQTRYKDVIKPRFIAGKRLEVKTTKNDKEKELVNLLQLDDIGTIYSETTDGLTKIEKDLKLLQDVKDATSGDGKVAREAMGSEAVNVLSKLIAEMKEKKEKIEKKVKEERRKDKDNEEKPTESFWKGPMGILTIIAIIAVVVGGIAYFIKANSSEGE